MIGKLFRRAAQLVEVGSCRRAEARDSMGRAVRPESRRAVSFDVGGAIFRAALEYCGNVRDASRMLCDANRIADKKARVVSGRGVASLNDSEFDDDRRAACMSNFLDELADEHGAPPGDDGVRECADCGVEFIGANHGCM